MGGNHGEALVVCLDTYDHHPHYNLPGAPKHAEEFRYLARRLGFTADAPPVTGTKRKVIEGLRRFATSPARRKILYWIGHGLKKGRKSAVVLPCRDLDPDQYDGKLTAEDMAELLRQATGDMLLILDTCHASDVAREVHAGFFDREDDHHGPQPAAKGSPDFRGVGILGTVHGDKPAQLGAWLNAFRQVCDDPRFEFRERLLWTPYAQALHASEVLEAVSSVLADEFVYPQFHGGSRLVGLFVNPYYDAMARPLSTATRSRRQELLDAHVQAMLKSRFTGLLVEDETSFFTGRRNYLDRLVDWIGSPGRNGALIVTGGPGSGKSALLAQLALMTIANTPQFMSLSPTRQRALLSAIDAGIQCRGRSALECARELAEGLQLKEPRDGWLDLRAVMDALLTKCRDAASTTFLVDGLDEADQAQIDSLVADVLVPLSHEPNVRVLIGTRPLSSGGAAALLDGVVTFDLDRAPDRDADIAGYVRARLGGPESPYRDAEETLEAVCRALVRQSEGTFLVAKLHCSALLRLNRAVGPEDEEFRQALASGLDEALDHEIRALDTAAPGGAPAADWALGLLLPLALSFGAGLPEDDGIWLKVARALAEVRGDSRVYEAGDVIAIRSVGGAHIVAHGEAGQPVFRLNHEALASHVLRVCGVPDPQAHATMVAVLRRVHGELYRGRGATNPYVARYVAAHAARAGGLAGLLKDAGLLVRLDPERLVAQLDQPGAAASAEAQLYRPVAEDLARKSPDERAALLQAEALRQQPELMPWARSAAPLHWTDQWTTAERSAPERSLGLPFGDVLVVCASPDGGLYAAGERLWRWSSTGGRPDHVRGYVPAALGGATHRLTALAAPARECGIAAVAADAERVLIWPKGGLGHVHVFGWAAPVSAVAVGIAAGREVVATAFGTHVAVWEWREGQPRHRGFWRSRVGEVFATAVTTVGGSPCLLVGGAKGVAALDPWTGACRGGFGSEAGRVECLAVTTAGDHPWVAAVTTSSPQIRVWRLDDGEQLRSECVFTARLRHPSGATVALTDSAKPLLLAVDGGRIRQWSMEARHEFAPLTGHRSRPTSVTVLRGGRGRVAVADGSRVRVWEHGPAADAASSTDRAGLPAPGMEHAGALVCAAPSEGAVALAARGAVRVWDLRGHVVHDESELAAYKAVDLRADASGALWLAAGGRSTARGPTVVVRRLDGGWATALPVAPGEDGTVGAVALATRQAVQVFAADNRHVRRWDVRSATTLPPLHVPNDMVRNLAFVESPMGRPFLLAGAGDTVWLWDGEEPGAPVPLRLSERAPVRALSGTHDDDGHRHVAVATDKGVFVAREAPRGTMELRPLSTTVTTVRSLVCRGLPGNRVLVLAADASHELHIWDVHGERATSGVPDRGFAVYQVMAQPEPEGSGLVVASVGLERMDVLTVSPPGGTASA
ncbi:NACHT and WD repeat domain-containing protein [Streptomyces sp. NPDC033538]|uniref:NACHT and WD repeat domain-containing protein n=1 Tax=Streptomyces sp. NPDC033538 TaxID=3155367 RepID=UPI0033D42FA2